jgi:hypothetical protein
LVVDI